MKQICLALACLLVAMEQGSAQKILFAADFSRGLSNGWENVAFLKKLTDFQVRQDGSHPYVLAVAERSCSALSTKLDLSPSPKLTLRWKWRIDGVATNGSERVLSRFDHAARVFVAFDTFVGPPRTLNYLWANVEPVGTLLEHPKSSRAQLIALESGNAKAGQWVAETRDLSADWRRAFPDKPLPRIVGLGLMTDSDSLGQKLVGAYADIELTGE